jgi:hypothetical protein
LTRLAELELLAGLFAGVFAEAELDEAELAEADFFAEANFFAEADFFAEAALSRAPSGTFLRG